MELVIIGIIGFAIYIVYGLLTEKKTSSTISNTRVTTDNPPKINLEQTDLSNIKLSEEQKSLFEILENSLDDIFVTGKAGTGKSLLLQYFRENTSKNIVVVAPTGVAALNVRGQTIHSLFRIPPSFVTEENLGAVDYKTATLLRNIDAVVIDEISMVRADLMDAIDYRLRQARGITMPFGGVQIIMFGDLYQLAPVVSDKELFKYFADNHGGYFFFHAYVWSKIKPKIYQLTKIFRQKDEKFKEILNAVREGNVNDDLLKILNERINIPIPSDGVITLATTNAAVSEINTSKLAQLPGEVKEYHAIIRGNIQEKDFPTEPILRFKKGAQVIFLKNDRDKKWVNGTIGKIASLKDNEIKVDIDGIAYSVYPQTWSKIRYSYNQDTKKVEEEVVSSFTQYPLRLAWALTVHKSQGQTYGSVAIDLGGGAFADGQTYVALSRCQSIEGLYLKRGILREDILVSSDVINFMKSAIVLETPLLDKAS